MAIINISICLSDIPAESVKIGNNGLKYLSLAVAERKEPDQYGQTHTVYVMQTKHEREEGKPKRYLGSGKIVNFQPINATPEAVNDMPVADDKSDLPF